MDTWRVDYLLLSDLKEMHKTRPNVYLNVTSFVKNIQHMCNTLILKSTTVNVWINENPLYKINENLSKMYPEDIVIIQSIKLEVKIDSPDPYAVEVSK